MIEVLVTRRSNVGISSLDRIPAFSPAAGIHTTFGIPVAGSTSLRLASRVVSHLLTFLATSARRRCFWTLPVAVIGKPLLISMRSGSFCVATP